MSAKLSDAVADHDEFLERIESQLEFARRLALARPQSAQEWGALIERAEEIAAAGLREGAANLALAERVETVLEPLAAEADEYTLFCCGHGHFDMNWLWTWPETLSIAHDTFVTMDRLMDEFPEFHFSQSMTTVYQAMQKHFPELFERIQARIAEGRWEVTASQWVEGDKNMASGEILCRNLLYSRRWLAENMGLAPEDVKIAWECDTFGFCATLPGILQGGGVSRLYHHRTSPDRNAARRRGELAQLTWFVGADGSRVLTWDDAPYTYNRQIKPDIAWELFNLERDTGLRSAMIVYGVGDHGGGPTRVHLRALQRMMQWPVWPRVRMCSSDDFFSSVEREIEERGLQLPENRSEINPVFEGCYTSAARLKFANRKSENELVQAEALAVLAEGLCEMPYPAARLQSAWEDAMFAQFHDIMPGCGVRETVDYGLGLFQRILGETGAVKTRALRMIAERVDTTAFALAEDRPPDNSLGAGAGIGAYWSGVSQLSGGESGADPFVVFNPAPFTRDELVQLRVWNRELSDEAVTVRDAAGQTVAGQVVRRGVEWAHDFVDVVFPGKELPALGWRSCSVEPVACEVSPGVTVTQTDGPLGRPSSMRAQVTGPVVIANDLIELTVSPQAGGITSLRDIRSGAELVPEGQILGELCRQLEAPHGMSSWLLGTVVETVSPLEGSTISITQSGPHLAAVRLENTHGDSGYALTISLAAGSEKIDFELDVNWLERGDSTIGVPTLRTVFPLAIEGGRAHFEVACGSIERPANGLEMPGLTWADLTGTGASGPLGLTLVNDSKYGYAIADDCMALTLIRSSYEPNPLPELGQHQIRYGIVPHLDEFDAARATRLGYAFNHPCIPQGTDVHEGSLPAEHSALELLTLGAMLSGLKRAEQSDGLVVRLYEMTGEAMTARLRVDEALAGADAEVREVDLLEKPVCENTTSVSGGILEVDLPAFGIVTVIIE